METFLKENMVFGSSNVATKIDMKTFEIVEGRLVKVGREKKVVVYFNKMEEYNFKKNKEGHNIFIHWLCKRGFASYAKNLVKNLEDTYYLIKRSIRHSYGALWEYLMDPREW